MASLPTCSGSSCTPCSGKYKTYFWSTHCHSFTTRDFKDLLSHKCMTLLSPSHIQLIHATLLKFPKFSFEHCLTLKPATLIPSTSEPPSILAQKH